MNKKIICLVVSGIFLLTIFASITTSCTAAFVSGLSEKKDIIYKHNIEPIPLALSGIYYVIAFGDFYVENDHVKGHSVISIGIIVPLPIPFIWMNTEIDFAIHNSNYEVWNCRYSDHVVSLFYIVP